MVDRHLHGVSPNLIYKSFLLPSFTAQIGNNANSNDASLRKTDLQCFSLDFFQIKILVL